MVQDVQKMIKELDEIDLTDQPYERAFAIFRTIRRLPAIVYTMQPKELIVFRTRTHDCDVFFKNVSDVTNPPVENVKAFGRCNVPNQSKFYASENRPTSFMELVTYLTKTKNVGEFVYATVSRWLIKRQVSALIVVSPDSEKRTSKFDLEHGEHFDRLLSELDPEAQEAYRLFYIYLAELFQQPANTNPRLYYITAAYPPDQRRLLKLG